MKKVELEKIELDLRFVWRLSRNATTFKENFIVKYLDERGTFRGEIAPNVRYDETVERIQAEFERFPLVAWDYTHEGLVAYLKEHNFSHAFSFGIESCWLHAHSENVSDYFGIPKRSSVPTSFSIPIFDLKDKAECARMEKILEESQEFPAIKVKVGEDSMVEMCRFVAARTTSPLRIDANEGFASAYNFLKAYEKIDTLSCEFMEQPFAASNKDAYRELKGQLGFPVMADESIESEVSNWDELQELFDGVNVKLMKAGSYLSAVSLLREAKKRNMKTMIGCMIETSLGISSAFYLSGLCDYCDLDGHLLIKNEPFGLLQLQKGSLSLIP